LGTGSSRYRGVGYAVEDRGAPAALVAQLNAVADAGFTYAELDPTHWDVILGGRLSIAAPPLAGCDRALP
jgi:hypothetical protein